MTMPTAIAEDAGKMSLRARTARNEPVSASLRTGLRRAQSNIPWKRFLTGGDCAAQKRTLAQNSSLRSAVSALMARMSRK